MARVLSHDGAVAVVWVGVVLVAGAVQSPMPWTNDIPAIGSDQRVEQYHVGHHARVLERAVAMIPDDVPVSAANLPGAHLSERERIYTFPIIDDAQWVIVDSHRPYVADRLDPIRFPPYLRSLRDRPDMRLVMNQDGVMVFRRAVPAASR